jgi:hypothetical protein
MDSVVIYVSMLVITSRVLLVNVSSFVLDVEIAYIMMKKPQRSLVLLSSRGSSHLPRQARAVLKAQSG